MAAAVADQTKRRNEMTVSNQCEFKENGKRCEATGYPPKKWELDTYRFLCNEHWNFLAQKFQSWKREIR
jgi:hypothetical protein